MPDFPNDGRLFGIDLAGTIHNAFRGQLRPGRLVKITKGPRGADPTAGRPRIETPHNFEGIMEAYNETFVDGTRILAGDRRVLVIARSLPSGIVPKAGDVITMEGESFDVVGTPERDPAAATYICQVRSGQ